ncbi:condensin complex subunit 2-like [Diorhabda sublineata]|uniref:condensin complex subunit 2-like n=1 Tax=Diorhabda sublineata TaxID=1163346 RepID=UPI0024E18B3F|nr:condensin complex subunit 2-like [Diorhabda sublineata]
MDTSTPMNVDLRRRTLLVNMQNLSSPLRRSVNVSMNGSTVEMSNDEDERADRRSQLQIQKRLSSISTPKINLNETYIKEQFVMYTHLFTENKITSKNAWKLQIIDMLRPLCQKSRQDVLQVASTSIDISAKVYGIRVDDVHSEGLKLASNMARVAESATVAEDDEGAENSEGEQEPSSAKKKKRKKVTQTGFKSTINRNPKGNLGKLPKLEPTDFTTRINADTGTIDNLFTNSLKETSYSFILLDKRKKFIEESDPIVQRDFKVSLQKFTFPDKVFNINPTFNDFIVDQWDPDQEEKRDSDKTVLSQIQPVVYDERGFPVAELDGSIHDIFETNDVDMDPDNDEVIEIRHGNSMGPELRVGVANVVDFKPMESTIHSSEYSFNPVVTTNNGKYIDRIWAGPSHWKLKFIRRSVPRFSGQTINTTVKALSKGRKKNQVVMIDFDPEPPEVDFSKKFVIKKRLEVDVDKVTLPLMDQSCARIMATIKELMAKPGVCPVEKKEKITDLGEEDFKVTPYKYENPNDSLYCSQTQNDDMGDRDSIADDEEHILANAGNLAEHLVDNPEMVPNTYIQYASKAKQIDMKKLKSAIWYKLTNEVEGQNNRSKLIPQTFSELYKALPELMQSKEKEKLSCPLACFALLHLANEQNLYLKQLSGNKDCYIMGPEYYTT